ncbi:MAG TPA: polysaccharide biosynthesis/export family protein [Salinarimonas sp.]|jgi:polysaccharide export outer membrane protein|nr:polysaccharide biosynthesis/export family protein [Salinarimonas sp.]
MNRRSALLLLACAGPLAGCASAALQTGGLDHAAGAPYTLASGDRLRIIVFGQDNLSNIYAVDGSGRIVMPLIEAIPVAGMSTIQAARAIEGRLKGGYLREPKVTVEIETYRPFFILGEVTTSGQFPFVNGMTVQTAVAIAGGFTPRAARTYAEISRASSDGIVTAAVPITYPVRPGDTIVIKERWF